MTRLTIIRISFIIILLMFAGQSYAIVESENILGIWLFDEGKGDIAEDSSGNSRDGTIINAPNWVDGKFGKALEFVSNSYVDCSNDPVFNVDVFSVSFWCNIAATQGWIHMVSRGQHFGGGNPGANNWGVMMVDGAETIRYEVFNDTGWATIDSETTIGEWHHVVATYDGTELQLYHDGELAATGSGGILLQEDKPLFIGAQSRDTGPGGSFNGSIDEVGYFNTILTPEDIEMIMNNGLTAITGGITIAVRPQPADGALIEDTWVSLSWRPGDFAVSHDVYIGEDFNAVNDGAEGTFIDNQGDTFLVVGFPGFPYPDGLVPGTTYYWRIDEVNDTEPDSPWKGDVWSFMVPPKTAYFPDPADGAEAVDVDVQLGWTAGFGAKLHTVYFGETFDQVESAADGLPQGTTDFTPGTLNMAKTYYWRVDEFDIVETHKGDVWSFITEGAVGSPNPAKGALGITQTPVLTWAPGIFGASHEIYFGTDPTSLELKGSGNLGSESYEPGQLEWNTTYYWRVDEANNANADSPWTGPLWSFTTANFLIIDDMESYNDIADGEPGSNRIYNAWVDGYDDPTNGSQTGHLDPPFYEETIVHGGNKSMPLYYDNAVGKSEATLTLTSNRDWTVNGINKLTIWYRGDPSNAAEQMYVVLNDSAVVNADSPTAALKGSWTEWNIDLQTFADQGVNLTSINTITIGFGNRTNPVAGGAGMVFFDDISLYAPAP
jgi:hypothetical protein